MRKLIKSTLLMSVVTFGLVSTARAQSLLPESIQDLLSGWNDADTVTERITGFIRLGLTLAFGAVVLVAVLYAILAAIKYIRSQGDAGQVEESNKAIKAIFQGVAAMFIGIIGVVIVFFIFDVALPDPSLPPICTVCPESESCRLCSEGDLDDESRCSPDIPAAASRPADYCTGF